MKPSLPQGTRDFKAQTVRKRQYILQTIQRVFELHGYEPLETPSMENLSTLAGKYGEEGDRLIFKILNNGLNETTKHQKSRDALENILAGKSDTNLTERALRYDLTIPFARYVAMNKNDIALPYKRYQMQPVWRADRPQRGRYREFWQCDADVVGSNSLLLEAELLNIYYISLQQLQIPQTNIKINNRKILAALAQSIGAADSLTDITIAIDKLDKIGLEKVIEELKTKNISDTGINSIKNYLQISGTNQEQLLAVETIIGTTEIGKLGLEELKKILQLLKKLNNNCEVKLDFTLARGLDYYTGMIVEITTDAVVMGSIGGGGRYDNLTGIFDYTDVSGVGISFGVDRIFDVMEELQLFPETLQHNNTLFFINFGNDAEQICLDYLSELRNNNIACDIYPEAAKVDKQMKYANKKMFEYVAIVGEEEIKNSTITLKNFITGQQQQLDLHQLIQKFI
jgi:histidyl-tRNA synthetase